MLVPEGFWLEKDPPELEKDRLPLEKLLESGEVKDLESVEVEDGGLVEKDRDGDVEGVVVFGADEKEREGDVAFGAEILGAEKDRLPELKPLDPPENPRDFARAGTAKIPSAKTTITTRARMRLTQVQGRMVPHPSGCFASENFLMGTGQFLPAFIRNE
ncbi:MAG: hypothetical protein ACOY93_17750 [Bacillota bacterium]